ncbi:MAG: HNH endonuclease [Balneolaceae bacterium]|nr:HNH endonuclease [Balneolaceae bacterium]
MHIGYTISESLKSLRSDTSNPWPDEVKGRAPHKPFLLLAILDGVEQGWITNNRIELSQSLIETFFEYWNRMMGKDRITTISIPFYHMQSEPFWKLVYKSGKEEYKSSPSLGGLTDRIKYAELSNEIFDLIYEPAGRNAIRSLLIRTYFSDDAGYRVAEISDFNLQAYTYSVQLEAFAAEPFRIDHTDEESVKYRVSKTQVRDAGFSKAVRAAYHFTCAICRSRVKTPGGSTLVDGAHIIPRSQSNNDDPRNGLALCKSHHWMFDQYMLTIKPDRTILLSKWLKEKRNDVGDLWNMNKKPILLPADKKFLPAEQALAIHSEKFKEVQ